MINEERIAEIERIMTERPFMVPESMDDTDREEWNLYVNWVVEKMRELP